MCHLVCSSHPKSKRPLVVLSTVNSAFPLIVCRGSEEVKLLLFETMLLSPSVNALPFPPSPLHSNLLILSSLPLSPSFGIYLEADATEDSLSAE